MTSYSLFLGKKRTKLGVSELQNDYKLIYLLNIHTFVFLNLHVGFSAEEEKFNILSCFCFSTYAMREPYSFLKKENNSLAPRSNSVFLKIINFLGSLWQVYDYISLMWILRFNAHKVYKIKRAAIMNRNKLKQKEGIRMPLWRLRVHAI